MMNLDLHPDIRKVRQFGTAIGILLCICAVKAILQAHQTAAWTLFGLAAAAGLCALTKPQFLRPVYVIVTLVTFPIGWTVSRLIVLLLYYGLMTPVACILRLAGRDRLRLKRPAESRASNWIERKSSEEPERYLRQY
jgi:hypothetical protein